MTQIAPILDYASPRKHVRLRLPAKSRIRCQVDEQKLIIIETLEGRDGAIVAIIFAVLMLIYMGALVLFVRGGAPMAVPWIAEAVVLLMVIHQTWRKTVLTVTPNEVKLKSTSPLTSKAHEWPASDVGEVRAVITSPTSHFGTPLGELHILLSSGGQIHLFTDHRAEEIHDLVSGIQSALHGEPPIDPRPAPAPVLIDPSIDAARTSGHLLNIQRGLRAASAPKINLNEPKTE